MASDRLFRGTQNTGQTFVLSVLPKLVSGRTNIIVFSIFSQENKGKLSIMHLICSPELFSIWGEVDIFSCGFAEHNAAANENFTRKNDELQQETID